MTAKTRTIRHRRSDSAKSRCQQRNRRKIQLFLKAYEYCQECDADISLTIRLRHSGEIVFFNSDGFWSPSKEQLATYYPRPKQVTWQEIAARYKS
ncbi:hypothetical protein BDV27DRAFT_67444 [Aspergillus caelatus]|uniref:Uncharacterized protein n=1 Tax=Aspergillus caelatus TaxID=61420 RepID=A0A5N6ZNL2_9EURO|nr:uncharacterized protein BDV27DRAFT_67444 [Aspergillus caelatus]KAE8358556.1 hypothetical protein BDV27DRAFT_67444 [Aspergillus caelatus]